MAKKKARTSKKSNPKPQSFKESIFTNASLKLSGLEYSDNGMPLDGVLTLDLDGSLIAKAACESTYVIANTKAQMKQIGEFILKLANA